MSLSSNNSGLIIGDELLKDTPLIILNVGTVQCLILNLKLWVVKYIIINVLVYIKQHS
jgi:hypothetical protein